MNNLNGLRGLRALFLGLLTLAVGALTGCGSLGVVNECAFEQATFCAGQLTLENQINTLLDGAGAASCVDVVHTCPNKAQCEFAGCGTGAEQGDSKRRVITYPRQ
ncbi:MAG: hypothetical protein AAF552_10845 [Pseudomonadota bacterium]